MHYQALGAYAGGACNPQSGEPCTVRRWQVTCTDCMTSAAWQAEDDRQEREREFAARHSVLSDADVAWARARNAARQP